MFCRHRPALLADLLGELAERPDCYYVKHSITPRDGMYLGRCFLTDEHEVGLIWAKYKRLPAVLLRSGYGLKHPVRERKNVRRNHETRQQSSRLLHHGTDGAFEVHLHRQNAKEQVAVGVAHGLILS